MRSRARRRRPAPGARLRLETATPWFQIGVAQPREPWVSPWKLGDLLITRNREKQASGETPTPGTHGIEESDRMSFEDRVEARLERWKELNPGAPRDAVERKASSIARRLREELDEAEQRRPEQS
jgi:hypothetical protein